jgi:hypothetical protein
LLDLKNINNMNEAFERQFYSGCLGPQITTKIGFTDKNVAVILLFPLLPHILQCNPVPLLRIFYWGGGGGGQTGKKAEQKI